MCSATARTTRPHSAAINLARNVLSLSGHGVSAEVDVDILRASFTVEVPEMSAEAEAALLVIDAQESFRHRPYFREEDLSPYLAEQQALIDGAHAAGLPVVQIFHVEGSGAFSEQSGFVQTMSPLRIAPDAVFRKQRHSALVGTGLAVWLTRKGVRRLIVSGIRTEQCCETTTRHASDSGYAVDYVSAATATFPMADASGRSWQPAEIRARTELVLAGRFARVVGVAEALGQRLAA
jgi:nicotinamidase-related amidase